MSAYRDAHFQFGDTWCLVACAAELAWICRMCSLSACYLVGALYARNIFRSRGAAPMKNLGFTGTAFDCAL